MFFPRAALALLLGCLFITTAEAQKERPFSVEDLYRLDSYKSQVLSPDGEWIIGVRSWIHPLTKVERSELRRFRARKDSFALSISPPKGNAFNPVFSPDGKWIAFLSTSPIFRAGTPLPPVPPESDAVADIWIIRSDDKANPIPLGGPDRPWGRVFHDGFYGRIAFSPDSKRLAFVADDGKDRRTPEETNAKVHVVRQDQGEGYTGYGPAQIWITDLKALKENPENWAAEKVHRVTDDDIWYGDPQWSVDGKALVVHANKSEDRESVRFSINKNFDLYRIDIATGKQSQLTTNPGPDVSPRLSRDGKAIAFLTIPRKGSHRDAFNLALLSPGEEATTIQTLFDHHDPKGSEAPHPSPRFPLPEECWENNDTLYYQAEVGATDQFLKLDVHSRKAEGIKTTDKDAAPRGSILERHLIRRKLPPPAFFRDRLLAKSSVISWKSDEFTIEGVLTLPPVGKPPYKLLLHPHGGPHSRSALGFDFTVQLFASQGYAVLQPNFRGSAGYGQKFIDADRYDFGGGDYRDCMRGVDHLIEQGIVDKDRLFVYGSSYGGYMTSWIVGQTNRFRAAVAQNAVTDLSTMWALSDLQSWTEWEFGGKPWEVPDRMRKHSPITYVDRVKTPTLILHAEKDRRVPLPLGRAYHQALLSRGVATGMVIYPDEGHGIRQPVHREDVYRRVLAWFEKHDKK